MLTMGVNQTVRRELHLQTLPQQDLDLWSTRFNELSPIDQRRRVDASLDLLATLRWNITCPLLNLWQVGFLGDVIAMMVKSRGTVRISPKQWKQIWIINAAAEVEWPEGVEFPNPTY